MKNENFFVHRRHICHLHISHNMPCLSPKFCKSFCKISSGYYGGPREIEDNAMLMQNFGGHTRSILGDVPISLCVVLSDEK